MSSLQGGCQTKCRLEQGIGHETLLHPSHLDAIEPVTAKKNGHGGIVIGVEDSFMTDGSLVKNNNIF